MRVDNIHVTAAGIWVGGHFQILDGNLKSSYEFCTNLIGSNILCQKMGWFDVSQGNTLKLYTASPFL